MLERFINLRDEQLTGGIAILGTLCLLALFIFGLLLFTGVGDNVRAIVLSSEGAAGEPTATPEAIGNILPPTWTPRATNTPSPTPSATPTETPAPTNTRAPSSTPTEVLTETPEATATLEITETPEPDYAATIAAAQSATPVAPPPAPVATIPPVPVIPPPPPAPVATIPIVPTSPPAPPTPTLEPTATPLPLFVLAELFGGPDCGYSGISGTVRNPDGTPLPGVTIKVFNEYGYEQALVSDAQGHYEAFLDSRPRADLAGYWHLRVLENGIQQSNEILVQMSGTCTAGETRFIANFLRTR